MTSCSKDVNHLEEHSTLIPVITTKVVIQDVPTYLETVGTLIPSASVDLRPEASGILEEILVAEGEWVTKETPLFRINTKLSGTKVKEARAQLAMDQTQLRACEKKLARFKTLSEKNMIAQSEWDELEANVERANNVIELDEARLESALIELERCTLKSHIEGQVGKIDAHPGMLVAHSQVEPLTTISNTRNLTVEFLVTEKEFQILSKASSEIEVQPLFDLNLVLKGTLTFLDHHFDAKKGLLLVRGNIENKESLLLPGQHVHVCIPIFIAKDAMLVPQKAIRYNQQGPYVYLVQEDMSIASRQLILGDEYENNQVVLEGIELEDRIITDGHLRLAPGSRVEIKS